MKEQQSKKEHESEPTFTVAESGAMAGVKSKMWSYIDKAIVEPPEIQVGPACHYSLEQVERITAMFREHVHMRRNLMNPSGLAKVAGVSNSLVYKLIKAGIVPAPDVKSRVAGEYYSKTLAPIAIEKIKQHIGLSDLERKCAYRPGLISIYALCSRLGMRRKQFVYRIKVGLIAPPKHRRGALIFYKESEVPDIVEAFARYDAALDCRRTRKLLGLSEGVFRQLRQDGLLEPPALTPGCQTLYLPEQIERMKKKIEEIKKQCKIQRHTKLTRAK